MRKPSRVHVIFWSRLSISTLAAGAVLLVGGERPAWAAEPMLDGTPPPAAATAPGAAAPQQPAPLVARPNSVRPSGMTIDLRGREHPLNAVVDADGKMRVRCDDAPGKE
jgi:hypothetical protein